MKESPIFQMCAWIGYKFKMDPVLVAKADFFDFNYRQAAYELVVAAEREEAERIKSKSKK